MALAAADYALRCHAADDLPCWSPVDLCNTAWALAAAGGRRRSDKLASAVDGLSGAFLALPEDTRRSYLQEECLVVWAAVSVTAPRSAQHVCAVAALRAREGFQSCNGSDMAGLMWAEVLVRRGGAVVAEAASEELCSRGAGACEPSELKVIAWAIAAARTPSKGRLQALKAIAADIVQSARWVQSRSPSLRLVRGAAAWACVAGGVDPEQLAAAGALPKWDSQNPLPPAVMREAKTRPGVTPRFLSIAKAAISASKREDAIIAEVSLEKMQIPAFLRPAYRGAGGRSEERE